jgi:hypothetical protein
MSQMQQVKPVLATVTARPVATDLTPREISNSITIDTDVLEPHHVDRLNEIHERNHAVFNGDIRGDTMVAQDHLKQSSAGETLTGLQQ